jgi:aminoglycoside phosphotransferase family enzyme
VTSGRPVTAVGDAASLAGKVAFLSRPESFPERCARVRRVETHFSWVFLAGKHVYKLKKPVEDEFLRLRTVDSRRRNCEEELRLNRRFSADVYEAVVPLCADASGQLRLGHPGEVVDWLVRMRRLPASHMLDRVIARGELDGDALAPVVETLCRVYAQSRVRLPAGTYRKRLAMLVEQNERDLSRADCGLPPGLVADLCAEQRTLLQGRSALDTRVAEGRIVEGHGDLRPEHVCLSQPPAIIDCLEFSRELRVLDPADELGFLALECERLGAPHARAAVLSAYARITGDRPGDALVHFYQSLRAGVRARLAIRHLLDPAARNAPRWRRKALRYLDLAQAHLRAVRNA